MVFKDMADNDTVWLFCYSVSFEFKLVCAWPLGHVQCAQPNCDLVHRSGGQGFHQI